jgi:hypothetical protein
MRYSVMLHHVAFVRTNVSEERRYIVIPRSLLRLLVNDNILSSSPILVTLIMEAMRSSETSVLARTTQCINPEYDIHLNQLISKLMSQSS